MDVDFSPMLAFHVGQLIGGIMAVGAIMVLPRLILMGVEWITGTVDDTAGDRWESHASKNGIWHDDDGYAFSSSGGITYVCPIATAAPAAQAYDPIAPGPLSAPVDPTSQPSTQPVPRDVHAVFSRPQGNYVDVLAAQGFQYAGCIETEKGTRVAMRGQGRTYTFDLAQVRKSGISPIVQCRI